MTGKPASESWYALLVRSRHEKLVNQILSQKGYEAFLPLYRVRRRWSDRTKQVELPLFPCYVFCRYDASRSLPILTTAGVLRAVGFGRGPEPVDECEIGAIRTIAESRLAFEPWQFIQAGERVRIDDGCLRGVEGYLVGARGRDRLVVSITLLQRSCAVEIDGAMVSPSVRSQFNALPSASAGPSSRAKAITAGL